MDLRQMEYFLVCAEKKNFSVAAEELYTSQPHVSEVIRGLEKELGCKLFTRTPRGVMLTEVGQRNYEYALNIVKNAMLMQDGNAKLREETFHLYTNSSSNMAVLFANFYKSHTQYHYKYIEAGVEEILNRVSQHEAELGFVFVPDNKNNAFRYALERKKLEFIPLVKSDMVVYVGKKNPIYGKKSLTMKELSKLKFVQMTDDFFSFQELLGGNLLHSRNSIQPDNVIETNSNHAMIQILNNTDLCNLCSYWLRDRYKYYDFQMIPVEGLESKITFGYVANLDEELSPLAKEFLAHIDTAINAEYR